MSRVSNCAKCGTDVRVTFWQSDSDRGDRGYVRSCRHGDYVPASELRAEGE
jgi:hypothetical protein